MSFKKLCLAIGLLICFGLRAAAAQELESEPAAASVPNPELEARALEIGQELERRQLNIQDIESNLGIYNPALVEAYSDLGTLFYEIGDFTQALDIYRQALQVARVNSGLKSEGQLAVIDRMIASSLALADWQSTDDMYHLRFYLKNQLFDPADPRFADAVDEQGRWKLKVLRENLLGQGFRTLTGEAEELSQLYQNGISKIQSASQHSESSLLPLFQGKSMADIEIARYLASTPYQYFDGTESEFVYQTVCSNVVNAQGQVVRNCYNVRRENPRYRASQQDAKRMAVNRSIRQVEGSINNLNLILGSNPDIPLGQREEINTQIRELQVEFDRITRGTRREFLF